MFILLIIALIPAMIAHSKGYSFGKWYAYGALLWFIATPHALLLHKTVEKETEDLIAKGYRECPFCREPVKQNATICPHCRQNLPIIKSEYNDTSSRNTEKRKDIIKNNKNTTIWVLLSIVLVYIINSLFANFITINSDTMSYIVVILLLSVLFYFLLRIFQDKYNTNR